MELGWNGCSIFLFFIFFSFLQLIFFQRCLTRQRLVGRSDEMKWFGVQQRAKVCRSVGSPSLPAACVCVCALFINDGLAGGQTGVSLADGKLSLLSAGWAAAEPQGRNANDVLD